MPSRKALALTSIGSILLGAAAAFAVPLALSSASENKTVQLTPADDGLIYETFFMESPEDGLAATHDGNKPIAAFPAGIGLLHDNQINRGFVLVTKLKNEAGEIIGFTSEQEVVSPDSNILQGRMMMDTTWTLTLPGRGTIFLSQVEDGSRFARDVVMPAFLLGRNWDTPTTLITTAGPQDDGSGLIIGGTGEFTGISGRFVEVTELRGFSKETGIDATIKLQLAYERAGA